MSKNLYYTQNRVQLARTVVNQCQARGITLEVRPLLDGTRVIMAEPDAALTAWQRGVLTRCAGEVATLLTTSKEDSL